MSESLNLDGIPEAELERFLAFREKVAGSNISEVSLLATDYLNHFNEIVMLLEMVPDMPDILDECKAWAPKSYADHFKESTFSDKALAIDAYDNVPSKFRKPFEETIAHMNRLVPQSLKHLDAVLETGDTELLRIKAKACSRGLQRLMDVASGIIHGSEVTMEQGAIDDLMGFDTSAPEDEAPPRPEPEKEAPAPQAVALMDLPNIGPTSAAKLSVAGISTIDALRDVGALEAYFRVKADDPRGTSLNLLYALQAGLMGLDWRDLPNDIKATLRTQAQAAR